MDQVFLIGLCLNDAELWLKLKCRDEYLVTREDEFTLGDNESNQICFHRSLIVKVQFEIYSNYD